MAPARPVTSDRTDRFHHPAADVWEALTAVERYRAWWPWLVRCDASDFTTGSTWHCTVRAALGYSVRFTVELGRVAPVEPAEGAPNGADRAGSVTAAVTGDIAGRASVVVTPVAGGCLVRIRSQLTAERPLLRRLDRLAPPVARWCHDRVLRSGVRRFAVAALDGDASARSDERSTRHR